MLNPDLPITKSSEDILNRSTFSNSLAKTLLQYSFSSSLTIGLYGEWGSGKTSLLNMVLETVESTDPNTVILRFNPWLCSNSKQLITQFFKQLSAAIKLKKPKSETAWELIDQYADLFDAANMIPGAGALISAFGKTLAKEAKERTEQESNDLQGKKDKIIAKMREDDIRVIVSIDDIDRLTEEEIISVFQLVKALADFPNTIYILVFDYNVVVRALSKVQHGDGKEYLEKIIQVPFEIPAPCITDIHTALFSKLDVIFRDFPAEKWPKDVWAELFQFGIKKYIKSIRDVIRYTNVFLLKYDLLKDETDPVDLLALTCLQVFEPFIYSNLPGFKEFLCGDDMSNSLSRGKAYEDELKSNVSKLFPLNEKITDQEAANYILSMLFPKVKNVLGISYSYGRSYSHRDFFVRNNVAAPECFDRYFALALEEGAISTSTIQRFIYEDSPQELEKNILAIYQSGKIIRLLDGIEAYANNRSLKISEERATAVITVLVRNWEKFLAPNDASFLSVPFSWRLLFCVDPLLERIDSARRFQYIQEIFNDDFVQPSTLALLLQNFERQLGRFTDDSKPNENAWLSLAEVLQLENIFKSRAINAIDSRSILNSANASSLFWMLQNIDPDMAKSKKASIITDDTSLAKVITACTSRGSTLGKIVVKTRKIDLKHLEEFINLDEAYNRIENFVETDSFTHLTEDEKLNTILFLKTAKQQNKEDSFFGGVPEDALANWLEQIKR